MAKEKLILIRKLSLNTISSRSEQVHTARRGPANGTFVADDKFCVETCVGLC